MSSSQFWVIVISTATRIRECGEQLGNINQQKNIKFNMKLFRTDAERQAAEADEAKEREEVQSEKKVSSWKRK